MKVLILFILLFGSVYGGENRLLTPDLYNTAQSNVNTHSLFESVSHDHKRFYSVETIEDSSIWFLLGAIIANSDIDSEFSERYQKDYRSDSSDELSRIAKTFGDRDTIAPVVLGAYAIGYVSVEVLDLDIGRYPYEWGEKTLRTMLVGGPVLLVSQRLTGGHRPEEDGSDWNFSLDSNGVSGHAFMGAVPFLTAAHMTENSYLKAAYYLGSTLCAWSRVNDDDHYLSQAILGWSIAYVSSLKVFDKEACIKLSPVLTDDNLLGISLIYRF